MTLFEWITLIFSDLIVLVLICREELNPVTSVLGPDILHYAFVARAHTYVIKIFGLHTCENKTCGQLQWRDGLKWHLLLTVAIIECFKFRAVWFVMLVLSSSARWRVGSARFTCFVCKSLFCGVSVTDLQRRLFRIGSLRFVIGVLKQISSEDFQSKS
jgi:hypothetical protein